MDEWNQTHHSASGLLERIAAEGVSETEAEALTLAFIETHVEQAAAPLRQHHLAGPTLFVALHALWKAIFTTAWSM